MNAYQQRQERISAKAEHDAFRPHLSDEQNQELDQVRAEGENKLKIGYAVFGGVVILIGLASILM